MKKMIIVVLALVLILGFSAMVFAATPDDLGTVTSEYQAKMLELKKAQLDAKVDAGIITQEQADEFIADMQLRQETCDGTGAGLGNRRGGMGFGRGAGGQGRMFNGACTAAGI